MTLSARTVSRSAISPGVLPFLLLCPCLFNFLLLFLSLSLPLAAVPARAAAGPAVFDPLPAEASPPQDAAEMLGPPVPLEGERADTNDVQHVIGDSTLALRLEGDSLVVPYFANRLLDRSYPQVTRAVVVIHGTLRNALDYYRAVREAGKDVPDADSTVLVIAPQFLTEADVAADTLSDAYLFWPYMGWRQGDRSTSTTAHPRPAAISSFAVADSILLRLARLDDNLQEIVVAGHSAGGQFVNRYAAGSRLAGQLGLYGITVRFVVSNPSSYLYFDDKRWVPGTDSQYEVPPPEQVALCTGYDVYKYGLEGPNEYMNIGSEALRSQYSSRLVTYLLGGADMNPNDQFLERNCEAMLQGEYRLQRGLLYRGHLSDTFGPGVLARHFFAVIANVGHDQKAIFGSPCGVFALYHYGSCTANLPNPRWADRTSFQLRAVTARAASWGDYDGDGRPDLFLSASDSQDKLLHNNPDGSFSDVTPAVMSDPQTGMSAAWVDYDGDGLLDLYTVNFRGENRLFRNEGGGLFSEQTDDTTAVGGDCLESDWADYDRDGRPDLYVTRMNRQLDVLLHNDGGGVFTDRSGIVPMDTLETRDVSWGDYDNDGDLDLYVTNNRSPNMLLRNDDSVFVDVTAPPLDDDGTGCSANWVDFDNDGDLDLFLINYGGNHHLYRNDGANGFTEVGGGGPGGGPGGGSGAEGGRMPFPPSGTARSACWGDFDNDGDQDLYMAYTGIMNRLYRNDGGGAFQEVTEYPINDMGMGICAAWADYDGDGNLDLYTTNDGNWNKLFRNKGGYGNHWLEVELRGVRSNRQGIGARVRLVAGGRRQIREVGCQSGSLAQDWTIAHFGLGSSATVDTLQVRWPSGIVQTEVPGFAADRRIILTESDQPAGLGGPGSDPPRDGRVAAGLSVEPPRPNPSRGPVSLVVRQGAPGPLRAAIYDAGGRERAVLLDLPAAPAGVQIVQWNGLDRQGNRVPAGIYFCRIRSAGGMRDVRVVRVE